MSAPGGPLGQFVLLPVDDSNRDACIALEVKPEQVQLVAPNSKSLREAAKNPTLVPLAFKEGPQVVGFAMYQRRSDGSAYIWRVMIGAAHQGRGLGTRLMGALVNELRSAGFRRITISHRPENLVAGHLFESFGFLEEDIDPSGEVIRQLRLE